MPAPSIRTPGIVSRTRLKIGTPSITVPSKRKDTPAFPAKEPWPMGLAAAEAIRAGDEGGRRAKVLGLGLATGLAGAVLTLPMSAFGVALIGGLGAMTAFGVGLLGNQYAEPLFGLDIDRHESFYLRNFSLFALPFLAGAHLHSGEFSTASALIAEAGAIAAATGNVDMPYAALALVAWRGAETEALELIKAGVEDATARGEGRVLALAGYAATRWPEVLSGPIHHMKPGDAGSLQSTLARMAAAGCILLGIIKFGWAAGLTIGIDPTMVDGRDLWWRSLTLTSGVWAIVGAWGLLALTARRRTRRFLLPLAAAWISSGTLFAHNLYDVLTATRADGRQPPSTRWHGS